VADGQGLVSLATHGVTAGVDLSLLTVAAALAYVTLFIAFVVWYRHLKRVWLLLLPVAFFFSARSLENYLLDLIPVAVVALATVTTTRAPAPPSVRLGRRRPSPALLVALPAAGVIVASVLAFASPPLQLSVQSVNPSPQGESIGTVTVAVRNRTDATVSPHFMVDTGNAHPSGFWSSVTGQPVVLAPHSTVTLTLRPPVSVGQPQLGSRWLVEAYTTQPSSLSASPLQVWEGWTLRP